LKNLFHRTTGQRLQPQQLKTLDLERIREQLNDANVVLSATVTWQILECMNDQIRIVEQEVQRQLKPNPQVKLLKTVAGIGEVLAPVVRLETGAIGRFASAGKYASYCRAVGSQHRSNNKIKGRGNTKNGNPYLSWAFVEAANFAVRFYPQVNRFYQRKKARTHRVVALKAIAHKLARASYYVMRDQVPFQIDKAFG
jgi:transposase